MRKGNGRPQESALGHSQKIVAGWWKWVGEKTKTGDSYQTAQEMDQERKTSLEKIVATELLKLAMETEEERKARLKKMVATTQLRLAPETEDERRARLEYLSDNPIYIPNNLYLILIVAF